MPAGKPLGGFHFHAASSSAGAAGDARRLSAPVALNDDDPSTVWTADTHQGRGEFFTARSSAGFSITGLKVLPGDTRSAQTFAAAARPRRLTLLFGRGPEQTLDVDLIEDGDGGAKRFRQPFWIPLPKPVVSGCLTVMIREVTTGRAATAIADLAVMTEIDGPQAVDRLVADLASGTSCETRRPLLASIGGAALDKVTAALTASPPGQGRACLIETLATLMPSPLPTDAQPSAAQLASALAAALIAATPDEEKIVIALLARLPEPPVSAIAGLLADEKRSEPDWLRAARVLALLAQPEARQALLDALGKGSSSLRAGLRETAAGAKPPLARATLDALARVPGSAQGRRADLLFVLAAAATREPEQLPAAVEILRATLKSTAGFEEQARAIQGLGMIRDTAAIAELAAFRDRATDGVLRTFATRELAGIADPEAGKALRGALLDSDPRAREAAVLSLGQRHDQEMAPQIIDAAKQEPWPSVRRAQVMALGDLCVPDGNNLLLRAYEKDVEDIRMAALVGLAHCRDRRASALLVRVLGRLPESADMRSLAARLLADLKDLRTTAPMAAALKRLQKESQSDLSLEGTITETVMALAAITGKDSVAAAVDLLTDLVRRCRKRRCKRWAGCAIPAPVPQPCARPRKAKTNRLLSQPPWPQNTAAARTRPVSSRSQEETPMEQLQDLLAQLRQFVAERDWQQFHDPKNLAMLLASEAGELLAEYRWVSNDQADAVSREGDRRARILSEVGDVGIALLLLCERIGADPVAAMRAKLEVNRTRYPADLVRGKSDRPPLK